MGPVSFVSTWERHLLPISDMDSLGEGVWLADEHRDSTVVSATLSKECVDHRPVLTSSRDFDLRGSEELDCAAKLSLEIIGTAGFDGYFKRLNAAAERILGYGRDELLATPFIEFVHVDDRAATESAAALLANGTGVTNFINRYRCKDGSYRWLQWQARSSIPDKLIYFAGRDVTEQKEIAERLRRQEEQYRLLFETNPSPMWVYDTETLKFLAVNDAAVRRYGYPRDEFLCLKLSDIRLAEDVASLLNAISDPAAPSRHGGEWRHRTKDGSLLLVQIYSSPLVFEGKPARMATAIDITERKRAEERLQEQATMLDRAHDAIIVRNFDDRRIVFWNSGAERLYGWNASEAIGQPISMILTDAEEIEPISETLLSTGEFNGQLKEITKDGRELIVDVSSTLMRNGDGSPRSVLSINHDITEQTKLKMQLLRSQRLESIGTVASGVAHDLNNILTPILICSEVLRTNASAENADSAISLIEESARRGAVIVKQVLTFARGIEGERVTINPRHLIDEMVDIARKTFPKSIEISARCSDELCSIQGDPTQLHQVLLNLSVNARDAMPDGGSLVLAAENYEVDENYASMTPGAKIGSHVMFCVSDTGTGMSRATVNKIFDPFFTTKEPGKGTGLGLSTAIGIVKSHGGFISVYSEQGRGTTFKIFFPVVESDSGSRKTTTAPELINGNGELILLVDDETNIRRVTRMILEKHNYRVIEASDAPEALAIFAQQMSSIRAVVTDIVMPYMDGVALVRALKKMKEDLIFVAATGQAGEPRLSELQELGVKNFLTKPYDTAKLLTTLHDALVAEEV